MILYTLAEDNGNDVTVFRADKLQQLIRELFICDADYDKNKNKIEKDIQMLNANGDGLLHFSEIYNSFSFIQKHEI